MKGGACIFCEIIAGNAPATIVEEWPETLAIVPLGPVVDGHVLIIPREHVADFAQSPAVTAATMKRAAEYAAGRHDSANVIISMGRAATQSVQHLHIHVVPRAVDDKLMVPWERSTATTRRLRTGAGSRRRFRIGSIREPLSRRGWRSTALSVPPTSTSPTSL